MLPEPPSSPSPSAGSVRKGMTLADVDATLGKPEKSSNRMEGTLRVVTNTYSRGDQVMTVEFVEGILIKYSISSK
jgi:hypothetical protein